MMKTMLASAAAVALTAGMAVADYTLTVLHTNDFHARFEPISKYDSGCGEEDNAEGKCFGGSARLVTAITQKPAQGPKIQFWWMAEINSKAPYFIHTIRGNWPLR